MKEQREESEESARACSTTPANEESGEARSARYVLKCWFDWGCDRCLWPATDAAHQRYNYPVPHDDLPLSGETKRRARELARWHDGALNWEYPPDPGPWRQEECDQFNRAFEDLLETMRRELGEEFEIIDHQVRVSEDPDLDRYLKDPRGFRR